ncbi:hypothetical protein E3N88_23701 [Mikania micrantha]|uniref:Tf2-1-like SH3-like domain-containing protein n=1 Tax=Mikania micrantha TaxID=192012 RepID=A0A5N6NFM8_9ASTR|nr:hypothetical protein E3N88_23701 [Mikania micrantha]
MKSDKEDQTIPPPHPSRRNHIFFNHRVPRRILNLSIVYRDDNYHFLPIRETYTLEKLSELFVKEIITRHGVPVSIVSDRDTRFVSRFWKQFHESMGTRLNISTAYHPQTDGHWDDHLPLVEFSYNNSYHASIGMPPYEALYGRRCRTPVCWGGVGQKEVGSKAAVLDLTEKLQLVKARMKAAQDRQKSYADKRRRPIEFEVGDQVLLKVSPWKGIIRFRKRGKLSPRFIGPFRIMARVSKVAYRLDLPDELGGIHPTFHVSHLRKCLADDVAYVPQVKYDWSGFGASKFTERCL